MKIVLNKSLFSLCVYVTLFNLNAHAQNMKEVPVQRIATMQNQVLENKISITFRADTIQNDFENGLQFSINIINNSTSEIRIFNPLDFLQIRLLNENGFNLSIQSVSSDNMKKRENEMDYETFTLIRGHIKNRSINLDSLAGKEITIKSNDNLEYALKVDNILASQDGNLQSNTNRVKIIPGLYKLGITLSIIGKLYEGQIFQSNLIQIELK